MCVIFIFFFFKQKTAYEMRISDWSSDVCSSDLLTETGRLLARLPIDPRLARMILAAADQQCLDEMLIIASALSVQDPRDRPMQERDASEEIGRASCRERVCQYV